MVLASSLLFMMPLSAKAQATNTNEVSMSELLELLQSLMAQVEELQAQLLATEGQVQGLRETITRQLQSGEKSDEVSKLQELLASDSEIYPEGLVTGYYGPLTRQAVMRFQARHKLVATGNFDENTRQVVNEYFKNKQGTRISVGFLKAPGLQKAVEKGLCDRGNGSKPFCPAPDKKIDSTDKDKNTDDKKPSQTKPNEGKKDDKKNDVLTTCGLNQFKDLVGTRVDREQIIVDWETYHGTQAGNRSVRILGEKDPMTMDYSETRLNVIVDENNVIERVFCG